MAIDPRHTEDGPVIYVSDGDRRLVFRIPAKGEPTVYVGNGKRCEEMGEDCGDGGSPTDASMGKPYALVMLPSGELIINEFRHQAKGLDGRKVVVRKVSADGKRITTITDQGANRLSGGEIAVTPDGRVILADHESVRETHLDADPSDIPKTIAGGGEQEFSGKPIDATSIALRKVSGVLALPDGSVLISDEEAGRIYRLWKGQLELVAALDAPGVMALDPRDRSVLVLSKGTSISRVKDGKITSVTGVHNEGGHCYAGYCADRKATETYFHIVNTIAASDEGLYVLDWPIVRFLPWEEDKSHVDAVRGQRSSSKDKGEALKLHSLDDLLPLGGSSFDLNIEFLTAAKQQKRDGDDRRFLSFYQELLQGDPRVNEDDSKLVRALSFERFGSREEIDTLLTPPQAVNPDKLKALRFLLSKVSEPLLRNTSTGLVTPEKIRLSTADIWLRLRLDSEYEADGKRRIEFCGGKTAFNHPEDRDQAKALLDEDSDEESDDEAEAAWLQRVEVRKKAVNGWLEENRLADAAPATTYFHDYYDWLRETSTIHSKEAGAEFNKLFAAALKREQFFFGEYVEWLSENKIAHSTDAESYFSQYCDWLGATGNIMSNEADAQFKAERETTESAASAVSKTDDVRNSNN